MKSSPTTPAMCPKREEDTVTLQQHEEHPAGLASPVTAPPDGPLSGLARFVAKTLTITELDIRKLRHDPTELFSRAVQPTLWLLVFGQVFTRTRALPTG